MPRFKATLLCPRSEGRQRAAPSAGCLLRDTGAALHRLALPLRGRGLTALEGLETPRVCT